MVRIAGLAGTGLGFSGRTAPFGVPMITEPGALAVSAEAVATMVDAAREDPDVIGVIIAAFGDPGLDAARTRLDVPVCGIGEASLKEAAAGGRRFAVATTTPELSRAIAELIEASGYGGQCTGLFFTETDPFAAVADRVDLVKALAEACEKARRESKADAVIIGGGPLAEAAEALGSRMAMPIIAPIPAAARLMTRLIAARKTPAPRHRLGCGEEAATSAKRVRPHAEVR